MIDSSLGDEFDFKASESLVGRTGRRVGERKRLSKATTERFGG